MNEKFDLKETIEHFTALNSIGELLFGGEIKEELNEDLVQLSEEQNDILWFHQVQDILLSPNYELLALLAEPLNELFDDAINSIEEKEGDCFKKNE